nr:MAG TPA: hypothetical protein [Bacteriophage sp.]
MLLCTFVYVSNHTLFCVSSQALLLIFAKVFLFCERSTKNV